VSPTPDSTSADPRQIIADLRRELDECRAERDNAQRKLDERTTERDEAIAQQTATAEVLRVINSSPGDLTPVFDAVLEKATRLCGAPFGVLRTWDGERFHVAAANGDVEFIEWARNYGPWAPAHDSSPAGRIVRGEDIVRFTDAPGDEAVSISPGFSALVEASGMRSGVVVALRKDDALLGNMTVYRQEVRPFSDNEVALLQNFAAQAVIAMENARLITETREALEQQTATAEVLQVINSSSGELTSVFDAILEKAVRLCGATHGHVFTIEGEFGRAVAARGEPEFVQWLLRRDPVRPKLGSIAYRMMQGEHVIQIPDSTNTEEYRARTDLRELIDRSGVRATLAIAMRNESALLGVIFVNRQEVRPFSEKQIALLENFAAQAVIAMENARLLTETREALEQQTATAEVLQVINSSPGDRTPVFEAILEKARILCGAAHGSLSLYDGEKFRTVAINTRSQELADRMRQGFSPSEFPHLKPLLDGAQLVHVPDLAEFGHPFGARTGLFVPLRKDDALLGLIATSGWKFGRSATRKSRCCRILRRRRSSRWRTRAS
jgi:GAF domain-containing protein